MIRSSGVPSCGYVVFVYIVYMKYVVCLHCVCEICCMFILVCENILPVYNLGQHGVSIGDERLPSNSIFILSDGHRK